MKGEDEDRRWEKKADEGKRGEGEGEGRERVREGEGR